MPTGEYCIYGILSPESEDVFETLAQGLPVIERRCFNILEQDLTDHVTQARRFCNFFNSCCAVIKTSIENAHVIRD